MCGTGLIFGFGLTGFEQLAGATEIELAKDQYRWQDDGGAEPRSREDVTDEIASRYRQLSGRSGD